MNKQQKKDKGWEERFRQLYEGANCEGGCISSRMCDFFIGFISTELQNQRHDYEILVNTILQTKNKEIQEAERRGIEKALEQVPEWIHNPLGEVNIYTEGRRDERIQVRELLNKLLKKV